MRVHVLSDLHLEFYPMKPAPLVGDMLALAGDIVTLPHLGRLAEVAQHYVRAQRPVFFVPGNHEYYGSGMAQALRHLRRALRDSGITLLHNRLVELLGVRVFGSTLWTDYELPIGGRVLPHAMRTAQAQLGDHRFITLGRGAQRRVFEPADALAAHRKALRLLDLALSRPFEGKTVVISHHGVHPGSVHRKWADSALTPAFVSDLRHVIRKHRPALMVHGHVHDSAQYEDGATRVAVNPRGYPLSRHPLPGKRMRFENARFDRALTVDI